jgi:hypothetical protein
MSTQISVNGRRVAEQLATQYKKHPAIVAVMLGGSVARGLADEYSDLEIGIFWRRAPRDEERAALITQMGGDLWSLARCPPDTGAVSGEHFGISEAWLENSRVSGTLMIDAKHATTSFVDRCLSKLLTEFDTSAENEKMAAAIADGTTLFGEACISDWKVQLAVYPDKLAIKIVQENLWFGPWYVPKAYAQRRDPLVLTQHWVWMQQCLLRILAALNRIYYPSSEHKWMDALIHRFHYVPVDLADRMREVFQSESMEGVRKMHMLINDTISLVERCLPEVNRIQMFPEHPEINTEWARKRWQDEPQYTLLKAAIS